MKIRDIPVDNIRPSKYQPRKIFSGIEDLAKSIDAQGLINPIVVRGRGDVVELIAGERRLKAIQLLGWKSVPAIVYEELLEDDVERMCVIDNSERASITAYEEMSSVSLMYQRGGWGSVELFAKRLGRATSWVARRLAVSNLIPEVVTACTTGNWIGASMDALVVIASMPMEFQEACLIRFHESAPTVAQVKSARDVIMRRLDPGTFDLSECKACSRRSSLQPDLFECCGDNCLDDICWDRKRRESITEKIAKAKNANETVYTRVYDLANEYGVGYAPDIKEREAGDPDAVPAVVLESTGTVRRVWIDGDKGVAPCLDIKGKPRAPNAEEKRMADVVTKFSTWLQSLDVNPLLDLPPWAIIALVASFGTSVAHKTCSASSWGNLASATNDHARVCGPLWEMLMPVFVARLRFTSMCDVKPHYDEAMNIAKNVFLESAGWLACKEFLTKKGE